MKIKYILPCILLCLCNRVLAQNLVPNPSFEEHINCDSPLTPYSYDTSALNPQNMTATHWVNPTRTPSAYFNRCASPTGNFHVPNCFQTDYQQPVTGDAFAGIFLYRWDDAIRKKPSHYREYLQTKLKAPLKANKKYCISFYTSPGFIINDTSQILITKQLKVSLTKDRITNYRFSPFPNPRPNDQYSPPTTNLINMCTIWTTDTSRWYRLQTTYTATGDENWLTIGAWGGDVGTPYQVLYAPGGSYGSRAYVYIDDVSILELASPLNNQKDTVACSFPLVLNANSDFDKYLWNTGDTTQSISVTQAGKYWVQASAAECGIVSDTINVRTVATPAPLALKDTIICSTRLPVTCRADGDYRQFVWSNGDTTRTTRIAVAGSYTVTATWACGQSTARLLVQTVAPLPPIALGKDTTSCLRGRFVPVVLSAPQGLPNYVWSTGETTRNIVARSPQMYSVASENLCGAVEGSIDIQGCAPVVYIPNAFSPNDDGNNDVFAVYTTDAVVRIRSMQVFDRWGQLVFVGENFAPTLGGATKLNGWDGTFRGQPAAQDVYVYLIDAEFADGTVQQYKGDVTLLR